MCFLRLFRMRQHFLQTFLQISFISLFKIQGMIFRYLCIFRNIACNTAVSIAHRFQQSKRHPFNITGQYKTIRVRVQLFQHFPLYKSGHNHTAVFCRQIDHFLYVFLRMAAAARNHQFFIRLDLFKRMQQIMQSLFRYNSCQEQDISVFFQTILCLNFGIAF